MKGWQDYCVILGVMPKVNATEKEVDLMLKQRLVKANLKIEEDIQSEKEETEFFKELNGYDEFA